MTAVRATLHRPSASAVCELALPRRSPRLRYGSLSGVATGSIQSFVQGPPVTSPVVASRQKLWHRRSPTTRSLLRPSAVSSRGPALVPAALRSSCTRTTRPTKSQNPTKCQNTMPAMNPSRPERHALLRTLRLGAEVKESRRGKRHARSCCAVFAIPVRGRSASLGSTGTLWSKPSGRITGTLRQVCASCALQPASEHYLPRYPPSRAQVTSSESDPGSFLLILARAAGPTTNRRHEHFLCRAQRAHSFVATALAELPLA